MLTDTNDLELRSDGESTTDIHCIDQLQAELDHFISSTMTRLDEVANTLREYERGERARQEKMSRGYGSENRDLSVEAEGDSPHQPPADEPPRQVDGLDVSQAEVIPDETQNQDESLTRLNAIKLRLAKQLEKN